jgi:long-chain acyl-CoA synthetase
VSERYVSLFEAAARRWRDRVAVVGEGRAITYEQLDRQAGAFARYLAGRGGLSPGGRLALAIGNRLAFVAAVLGALKGGLTVAPLDVRLTSDERRAVLDNLRPAATAHDVVGDEVEWPAVESGAPPLILYTSGSTGAPKGAVLSQAALVAGVRSWIEVLALTADDVVLAVLPLSHSYGLNGALLAPLVAGARVVVLERFAPAAVAAAVRDHGVTVFPGVATMFRRLLDAPDVRLADFAGLRLASSGAAPCPWSLAQEWRERTGVRILRGYGMTELFRPISYLAGEAAERPDAIGRAVPGVELLVVDGEGRALPCGEIGELWIRSPAAMDAYLDALEETAAVLDGGWFRTGDLARIGADGLVTIEGRTRERILRGGYSVFPPEVETALLAHPAVGEAAVVGVPDADLGEEVAAFVVLRPGAVATPEDLVAWCRERLAAFKYPRRVALVAELPRGATGKVLKRELRRSPAS